MKTVFFFLFLGNDRVLCRSNKLNASTEQTSKDFASTEIDFRSIFLVYENNLRKLSGIFHGVTSEGVREEKLVNLKNTF